MIVKITINGKEYEVNKNETILNICQKFDIFVPSLCYLKGFSPTGACGLCAVEIENSGVVHACRTNVENGMSILTDSHKALSVRKLNMERLLKRHHINCFNCQKNGVCKFQEYTFDVYANSSEKLAPAASEDTAIYELTPDLCYDDRKCINCMKCVKFLNTICNCSLKSPKDLQTIENVESDAFLNIADICPTAALSIKSLVPDFACEKTETFDINDVFTPKINVLSHNNKVFNITPENDTYIKDKNRLEIIHLPNRVNNADYQGTINELKQRILSNARELNIFIVGDNIDLVSFSYLKILAQKFDNLRLCFNGFNIPYGLKKFDLTSMDFIFFLGEISSIDNLRFSLNKNKLREFAIWDIEQSSFKDLPDEKFSQFRYPYLIVYSNIFKAYPVDFVLEKIQNFEKEYYNKFGINLNTRIIPQNLSQMLISRIDSHIPITDLFSKFNRHDILSLCIIGDINHELKIPEETYAVSNSVFEYPGTIHIPSKHYIEDENYYINIFGELLKTKCVIESDLKSNREFLYDLMKNIFEDRFDSINDEVKRDIRGNFFEKQDIKYF